MFKFALLSNVIPPSWSGQAVLLGRLLQHLDPSDYYLITTMDHAGVPGGIEASSPLPAKTVHIPKYFPGTYSDSGTGKAARMRSHLNQRGGHFRRIADYIQLVHEIRSRAQQIEDLLKEYPTRTIIACTGDFYDIPAAFLAARASGIELLPYILDDYAYQWTGWLRPMSRFLESRVMHGIDRAIVTNAAAAAEYTRRYGIHCEIIHNLCPIPELNALTPYPLGTEPGTVNIVYTGAIYHAHFDAFRDLVQAIEILSERRIQLHLFTAQSAEWLATEGIGGPHVIHHGHIPVADVPRALRQADIVFLALAFRSSIDRVLKTSSPNKMGDCLAIERPILVHAPGDTFLARYFREHRCGVVVDTVGPQAVADALEWLIQHPDEGESLARNARMRALLDYDPAQIERQFEDFVESFT